MADTKQLNLKIPVPLDLAIKKAAKKSGQTASEYIREALAEATGYTGPQVKMGAPTKVEE